MISKVLPRRSRDSTSPLCRRGMFSSSLQTGMRIEIAGSPVHDLTSRRNSLRLLSVIITGILQAMSRSLPDGADNRDTERQPMPSQPDGLEGKEASKHTVDHWMIDLVLRLTRASQEGEQL